MIKLFSIALLLLLPLAPARVLADDKKLAVTTTTTMVTDLVEKIGGDRVTVQGLMGPGVDPHLYKASASDAGKLTRADLVFYSGLMLEGKLQDLFTRMSRTRKHVYAVTAAIPEDKLSAPPEFKGHHDPHVWFDVTLWQQCIPVVVRGLAAADPAHAADYQARGAAYAEKLQSIHQWALRRVAELPAPRRILVTSHDAYNYFGRAYGFQVVGLQGISTVDEASLSDVVKLVDFIRQKKVKAIFVESSVPPNTIERISRDAGVRIGGELFSDAMGTPGKIENGYDVGTYEGMIKHNINTIVDALK